VILAAQEVDIRRTTVGSQPGQKVLETSCLGSPMAGHDSMYPATQGITNRRTFSIKQDPMSKLAKAKRTEGMAQVVEHLQSKCEAEFKLQYHPKQGQLTI
jgi:hypothetical protein